MQLERLLQTQGFGTRRECRSLVRHGAVCVAGNTCDDPFVDVEPNGLDFSVRGEAWTYRAAAYVMLNKPAGYECSRQPMHHRSIFSLLPAPLATRGVQPVGRLDEDTTGLLLLSDDGAFIHALSSPRRHIAKVYDVTAKHPLTEAMLEALLAGVQLHDEAQAVVADACEQTGERTLKLTISGGKYHQVKRMLAAAGNRVEALKRIAVGAVGLPDDLPPGAWRWLTADELASLGFRQ